VTRPQAARGAGHVPAPRTNGHITLRVTAAACGSLAGAGTQLAEVVALPVPLPGWVKAEPCPRAHLDAMLAAARAMRGRAEAALADFIRTEPPRGGEDAAARLRGQVAKAGSVVAYGEALWSPDVPAEVHERVENWLRRGITAYYELGQLLAMPVLADRPQVSAVPVAAKPLPLPGEPGFDPWCLTDRHTRARWQRDPAARRAIA
jgi:hypothetical protein